jgi:alpha-beta hydrolase superfamily lysophospholipase
MFSYTTGTRSPLHTLLAAILTGMLFSGLVGCNNAELSTALTRQLKQEFSIRKTPHVDSFSRYLELEDALFAELDERVYAKNPTGAAHALERYSKGSLADPGERQPNWNRSFELSNATPAGGVLLLHGMSDSPYSLRAIGETLQQQGYYVVGLRMPGHGTAPSGLLEVSWQDMAAVVDLGVERLLQQAAGAPVHIIGYSTGAALALDYSLRAELDDTLPAADSLVLISPAIGISAAAGLAKWGRRLSYLPGLGHLAWLDVMPEFDPYKYNSFATNAAEQVNALTQSVASRIAARENPQVPLPPVLVLKSTVDATVSNDAVVDRLLSKLAPKRHEMVLFDINRFAANASLLKKDPGPFTERMIADEQLPFGLTLVANSSNDSRAVTARYKAPFQGTPSRTETLEDAWPPGVFSLSHVALPFPPDDPLYGQEPPTQKSQLFLGKQALQGERNVLKIPGDFLLRLRYNPFYNYLEKRTLDWLQINNGQ